LNRSGSPIGLRVRTAQKSSRTLTTTVIHPCDAIKASVVGCQPSDIHHAVRIDRRRRTEHHHRRHVVDGAPAHTLGRVDFDPIGRSLVSRSPAAADKSKTGQGLDDKKMGLVQMELHSGHSSFVCLINLLRLGTRRETER
jgi:hypothetical protein